MFRYFLVSAAAKQTKLSESVINDIISVVNSDSPRIDMNPGTQNPAVRCQVALA